MPAATLTPPVQLSLLNIGEVAVRLGVSVHTLRYYERAGLLDVPRQESGVRRYGGREIELLRFLLALRATGMPIALIRRYIGLARLGEVSEVERHALLMQHGGTCWPASRRWAPIWAQSNARSSCTTRSTKETK